MSHQAPAVVSLRLSRLCATLFLSPSAFCAMWTVHLRASCPAYSSPVCTAFTWIFAGFEPLPARTPEVLVSTVHDLCSTISAYSCFLPSLFLTESEAISLQSELKVSRNQQNCGKLNIPDFRAEKPLVSSEECSGSHRGMCQGGMSHDLAPGILFLCRQQGNHGVHGGVSNY